MLGSNQRPLPCEDKSITLWLFAGVQKYLRNSNVCPSSLLPLFALVGVLVV